jgi:hypothetical protein
MFAAEPMTASRSLARLAATRSEWLSWSPDPNGISIYVVDSPTELIGGFLPLLFLSVVDSPTLAAAAASFLMPNVVDSTTANFPSL